jgi:hypothetical protein
MSGYVKALFIAIPVFIVAVIAVLFFSFNSIVKNGVEAVGPKVLGTDVVLQKVDISLLSGSGMLKGIMIGNPEGFHTESAFRLGEVKVAVDIFSVLADKMIIDEIVIDSPEITYETSGTKNNIEAILDNIKDLAGGGEARSTDESTQKSGKKLQINDIIIRNAKVNMSATILQGEMVTLSLSDIHIEDIGKEGEGANMSDALKEVFTVLDKSIAGAAAAPIGSTGETVEKTVDKIKGLFDK